jgi:hypothetical protein
MTKEEQQTKAQKLILEMASDPDIIAIVKSIEARVATTQNHYGDYGAALNHLSNGDKAIAKFLALAFIHAGGNKIGVLTGLDLFN